MFISQGLKTIFFHKVLCTLKIHKFLKPMSATRRDAPCGFTRFFKPCEFRKFFITFVKKHGFMLTNRMECSSTWFLTEKNYIKMHSKRLAIHKTVFFDKSYEKLAKFARFEKPCEKKPGASRLVADIGFRNL